MTPGVRFQPSLFAEAETAFDASLETATRVHLDATAWVDHVPGWVTASDRLFEMLLARRDWQQRTRFIVDHDVLEPRLTSRWTLASGVSLEPPILESIRRALSSRYGVVFDSVGFNLYRDGRDSVAWHRDRIRREVEEPVVPLLSLGEPRKLMFRPLGGGASRAFALGRGDLLVTGGTTQRRWEHAILKVARAGPRISLAFRYGVDPRAYGRDDPRDDGREA
jgi:hypothetical protein